MTTFGLHLTDFDQLCRGGRGLLPALGDVTDAMEDGGTLSSLWLTDHMMSLGPGGVGAPMPESYVLLGAVAARTRTLRMGVLATSVHYRSASLLAKMASTLDVLADGRTVLGIGAGHPRTEGEHRAYGYEFPPIGERIRRLSAALDVIRPMTRRDPQPGVPESSPRPVQDPGIPILVAGSGDRMLGVAARYADLVNLSCPSGDTLATIPDRLEVLRAACATAGRDPGEIAVTYKAMLSVADSSAAARESWELWRGRRGLPDRGPADGVFVGSAHEVAEQLAPWLSAGIDHLAFELAGGTDAKSVTLASEALAARHEGS